MKRGVIISAVGHGVVLLWALVSFARPFESTPVESMPVDIISADDFSKMMAGAKNAPKELAPKPLVEKVAEAKPVEDPAAKVVEKKEVKAAVETPPVPEVKPKPKPDPKPAATPPQPKTEAKAPDKKEPEQKIDPIANALKKDEAKKPEKKAESTPRPLPPKPEPQPPKFDPRQVAALLNKNTPQRTAAAGNEINPRATLGYTSGQAAELSEDEKAAFRRKVSNCWTVPAGMADNPNAKATIRVSFNPDGTFAAPPDIVRGTASDQGFALAESAKRALLACRPYTMLRPEHYEGPQGWKEMDVTFTADELMNPANY